MPMQENERPREELENRIGYRFADPALLERALTHSSFSNETGVKNHHLLCNERLEFLGDSVLSLITSEYIFATYDSIPEGDLTRMRSELVCEKALSGYAETIRLGQYLLLGKGEEKNHGRERKSILADAFEALLAAIYLDSGSKETVRTFLLPFIAGEIEKLQGSATALDYKTKLQELVQQAGEDQLTYGIVGESGPDHQKVFEVEARVNSNIVGHGRGHSKREAEQNAAKEALKLFGVQ